MGVASPHSNVEQRKAHQKSVFQTMLGVYVKNEVIGRV